MSYTLLGKINDRQSAYLVDFDINYDVHGEKIDYHDMLSSLKKKIDRNRYEVIEDKDTIGRIIIVSDAITHIERLVFPGVKIKDKLEDKDIYTVLNFIHIAGDMTMMTMGGSYSHVYEVDHYVNELREANNE